MSAVVVVVAAAAAAVAAVAAAAAAAVVVVDIMGVPRVLVCCSPDRQRHSMCVRGATHLRRTIASVVGTRSLTHSLTHSLTRSLQ